MTVTVQGTPQAVEAAARTLSGAFTARDDGAAAGDQERERQLLPGAGGRDRRLADAYQRPSTWSLIRRS
ncbi:hypothetical protein STENM223S_01047 [Streptomyces tendae]